jgi:hypothetical protein
VLDPEFKTQYLPLPAPHPKKRETEQEVLDSIPMHHKNKVFVIGITILILLIGN